MLACPALPTWRASSRRSVVLLLAVRCAGRLPRACAEVCACVPWAGSSFPASASRLACTSTCWPLSLRDRGVSGSESCGVGCGARDVTAAGLPLSVSLPLPQPLLRRLSALGGRGPCGGGLGRRGAIAMAGGLSLHCGHMSSFPVLASRIFAHVSQFTASRSVTRRAALGWV